MAVVEDGSGNRFLRVEPLADGLVEIRIRDSELTEAKLVTAWIDAAKER